MQINPS